MGSLVHSDYDVVQEPQVPLSVSDGVDAAHIQAGGEEGLELQLRVFLAIEFLEIVDDADRVDSLVEVTPTLYPFPAISHSERLRVLFLIIYRHDP